MKKIIIAGAGPAGITAAINLARAGFRVTVYDKTKEVGARFFGDTQALENLSSFEDALEMLKRMNIAADFPYVPFNQVDILDGSGKKTVLTSSRPGGYLVRRGTEADCLDQALKGQAEAAGVELVLGNAIRPLDADIIACGPQRSALVAAGILLRAKTQDRVAAILDNKVVPGGYAYLSLISGWGTLAVVLFSQFALARECLAKATRLFQQAYGLEIEEARPFSGHGDFHLRSPFHENNHLWVGEAAGLQDYWFGFGLRPAIASGYLAAQAISQGKSYNELLEKEAVRQRAMASLANRFLFEKRGWRSLDWLTKKWARTPDILALMQQSYCLTMRRRLLYHLARWSWGRNRGLL